MIRSRQKEVRRHSILDAAETLIRETGGTDFSMLTLAERSGLSPATPYNIFGSKNSILYALLNRSLDNISTRFAQSSGSVGPYDFALTAADAAARFFVLDPGYYRPLYSHLIGRHNSENRPAFMERSFQYWRDATARLRSEGVLADDRAHDILARSMMVFFLGSLDLWTQAELADDDFVTQITYAVGSLLSAIDMPVERPVLSDAIAKALDGTRWPFDFRPLRTPL
jgi:AcrR family transcriptional regulator